MSGGFFFLKPREAWRRPRRGLFALGIWLVSGYVSSGWAVINLGPQAAVTASSYDTRSPNLYRPEFANDGKANPDNWYHWCNDFWTDSASATNPVRLTLTWPSSRSIRKVVVHTKRGYEVQDFRIDYLDGSTWKLFFHSQCDRKP